MWHVMVLRCPLSFPVLLLLRSAQISPFMSALALAPGDALTLMYAEVCAGNDLQALLELNSLNSLARQWQSLTEEVQVPMRELMAALTAQVQRPDCR